jgi:hypothetical protein
LFAAGPGRIDVGGQKLEGVERVDVHTTRERGHGAGLADDEGVVSRADEVGNDGKRAAEMGALVRDGRLATVYQGPAGAAVDLEAAGALVPANVAPRVTDAIVVDSIVIEVGHVDQRGP